MRNIVSGILGQRRHGQFSADVKQDAKQYAHKGGNNCNNGVDCSLSYPYSPGFAPSHFHLSGPLKMHSEYAVLLKTTS
jgi:hypothetical protein